MQNTHRTVEGMNYPLIAEVDDEQENLGALISLAAAGEAAVSGVIMQAVADSDGVQDDYAYYINDGVYGAFNNIMFDHATIRPRVLHVKSQKVHQLVQASKEQGVFLLDSADLVSDDEEEGGRQLFSSTIFGPTCDSIDVVSRSVLLPKLKVGDWLYFQNMGAYTMAAASSFNGFDPTEKFYVCSVRQKFLDSLILEPGEEEAEEKKQD
jgi:ornithine decarboxylase